MHVIIARNVNDAYRKGLRLIAQEAIQQDSRNGPVLRVDVPVTTMYQKPTERVLFDVQRNANPFFHLVEALWMLAGQNDVETLVQFLPGFKSFSDDGRTLHGAYGHRWRHWPMMLAPGQSKAEPFDQLAQIIGMLKRNPTDRRAIIGMWDPNVDLGKASKDIPCNDLIQCSIRNGALDIQVFCRSNDIVFGCYGANAVQFSILQEYLAALIGVPVGRYWQISADYHAYTLSPYRWESYWPLADNDVSEEDGRILDWTDDDLAWSNPYANPTISSYPLVEFPSTFDYECRTFAEAVRTRQENFLRAHEFQNPFFERIALPMVKAHREYKRGSLNNALDTLAIANDTFSTNNDWLFAGTRWIERKAHPAREVSRR